MANNMNRRTLVRGAAWSAPAIMATAAIPAYAASPSPVTPVYFDSGIFVSAANNFSGSSSWGPSLGSTAGTITASGPSTLTESFGGPRNWSVNGSVVDRNFNTATGTPISGYCGSSAGLAVNGEGQATPTGMGSAGTYSVGNYFWFSAPTSSPGTGTGYSGSTTMASGATFVTTVQYDLPAGKSDNYLYPTLGNNGQVWKTSYTLNVTETSGNGGVVQTRQMQGTSVFSTPVVTTNSNGTRTFKATVTFTTNKAYTANAGQIIQASLIGPIKFPSAPGAGAVLTTTSYIQNASFTTSTGKSVTLTNAELQSSSLKTC